MENEFQVGPIVRADSSYEGPFRASRQGDLIVCDGHGRFYELASRNQMFCAFTANAGTTIVAGNVAPPAAAAATVLSILNPIGSGVNLEILQGWVMHISGTPGAGLWSWSATNTGVSITAAEAVAQKGALLIGQGVTKAKAWSQTALTGGIVHVNIRPFPSAMFAGAIAATTPGQTAVDNVDGAIVVVPGGLLTLAPPAAGTTHIVCAGIQYAEIPLPG